MVWLALIILVLVPLVAYLSLVGYVFVYFFLQDVSEHDPKHMTYHQIR